MAIRDKKRIININKIEIKIFDDLNPEILLTSAHELSSRRQLR